MARFCHVIIICHSSMFMHLHASAWPRADLVSEVAALIVKAAAGTRIVIAWSKHVSTGVNIIQYRAVQERVQVKLITGGGGVYIPGGGPRPASSLSMAARAASAAAAAVTAPGHFGMHQAYRCQDFDGDCAHRL